MNPMKTEQVRQVRRAALAAGVGAALVGGVLLFVPDHDRPAVLSPEARAMAAAGSGAPASLADLTALIRDREAWLRTHPKDGEAWAVLGSAYVERGSRQGNSAYYPKADQALQRSLATVAEADDRAAAGRPAQGGADGGEDGKAGEPAEYGNPAALVGLARLANARHDFATARKWAETVRKQRPDDWTPYPVLIDAYSGLGEYKAAGEALDRLKELHSGTPVLERAAAVYRELGRHEDATAKATEAAATADTPEEKAEALHTLGRLSWDQGRPAKALDHYDAALAAAHAHPASMAGRARALAALGRTDEAYQVYEAALGKLPLPEYALELGELYDSEGLTGDAQTQYEWLRERVGKAQAHGVNEQLVLARFETDHGDPEGAVVRLTAEWTRSHRSMYVADALAWALHRAGRSDEALAYARKATRQGLRNALFSYHLGEIERTLGMRGPARRHIEEALRINPYFSPLLAPKAREALNVLENVSGGGPMSGSMSGPKNTRGQDVREQDLRGPDVSGPDTRGQDTQRQYVPEPDTRTQDTRGQAPDAQMPDTQLPETQGQSASSPLPFPVPAQPPAVAGTV
ncbi:tetratricopeptide repeat protein [Streptomyces sp. NPDC050804]|uniref:tetratricopeptide repeat protein n=1 Tax=Streptomyces sp. NPDC050804 TaxID=3154745 RepID=UPI00343D74FD